jgi:hypothetical protein
MPQVPKIHKMPETDREWLDTELAVRGHGDYRVLSDLLAERGYEISKSAIHAYDKRKQIDEEALRLVSAEAKTVIDLVGDDCNALGEAATALALQKAIGALAKADIEGDLYSEKPQYEWTKILRAIGSLSNSNAKNKEYRRKVQVQTKAELDKLRKSAQGEGDLKQKALEQAIRTVEETIYGIK